MPKREFYTGQDGESKLGYKCNDCRRMHDSHEDAVACEHGHVKMLVYEQVYDSPGASYPAEIDVAFADGNIIKYEALGG